MPAVPDDKRAAIGLSANLSGQLVQAAVAMLTGEGAYIAYALASRDTKTIFALAAAAAAISFVSSIYFSGCAVTESRNKGFDGDWLLDAGKKFYNLQALSLMVGLLMLAVMLVASGNSKDSDLQKKIDQMSETIQQLKSSADADRIRRTSEQRSLESRLGALQSIGQLSVPVSPLPQSSAVSSGAKQSAHPASAASSR